MGFLTSLGNDILRVVGCNNVRGSSSMQVNDLGFIATILFVLVPTVFLLILFIQTRESGSSS